MRAALALITALALPGCGLVATREARDPGGKLVGMSVPDLLAGAGKPDAAQQTGPDTAILQYNRTDASTGLKATVTLLGSIELGGGGGCKMVVTILRDGTVADVAFPGAYEDSLFAPPYAACAPLLHELLTHPSSTSLPRGYDAFRYVLGPAAQP